MEVEIERVLRETAGNIAPGVPYALKATAARLAGEPDLGVPSALPGILSLRVDGDLFEDCPDLDIGYIREPDRIRIRFVRALDPEPVPEAGADGGKPATAGTGADRPAPRPGPAAEAVAVRQVADAWGRVTGWLRDHAPGSYAALRPGAGPAALAALEAGLGRPVPVELRVLWLLTAGDDGVDGGGCLPGNEALMPLETVADQYRTRRAIPGWRASWIPVVARGTADTTSGLYLDAETGCLGRWSRYDEPPAEEPDTLVTYLEETADMLRAPALATRDRPGLAGGVLRWAGGLAPGREGDWRPLTG
ncbi:hypothetical protein [Streptomyces daghestanicus]|uniref:Knr4/Smi1-like domain-containing protein n=1 Tax=Streptomyces daghestanicus TaxID=66885 RepID=A0ABQ3Q988_9ACTN|nr:hypothetical protein [Streptomyces daghestanicus]GGU17752.1 hypothetical protein GCM10010259_05020 [Streptomyces daghestanicus]GHI33807.1 hypothetical protein Sdagh_55370 [Streptomyces daghestanicus]